jgi:predicted transcriptional regulator
MATTGNDMTEPEHVLHIRFERSNTEEVEQTLRAIDNREEPEPYYEATFHDPDQFHQVTRPTNLELLRTISRTGTATGDARSTPGRVPPARSGS